MYSTFISGDPKPQARPRGRVVSAGVKSFVSMYSPVSPWRRKVRKHLKRGTSAEWPLEGAVEVRLHFVMVRPKSSKRLHPTIKRVGDVDNLAKAVLDAMSGLVFEDDAQVCDLHVTKHYGPKSGVEVTVAAIPWNSFMIF
jgi:Holliday junction resolvase RusA-like endonuclease